jgi:hypothetical protein
MEKKFNLIVNCETGEETLVEFTAEEYAQAEEIRLQIAAQEAERLAAAEATAATKASAVAKLEAVGLTADEIAALTK